MTAQVRLLLHDVDSQKWTNNVQVQLRMQDAAVDLWDLFIGDERARHLLEVYGPAIPMVVYTDRYALPSDCLRVKSVEYRTLTTRYATLVCGATPATAHTDWTGITHGSFRIFSDDRIYDVMRINLSTATDMDGVAALLQAALRAETGGTETVTYDAATTAFTFSAYNTINVLGSAQDAATAGIEDLSGALWLNGASGAGTPRVEASVQRFVELPYGFEGEGYLVYPSSGTSIIYNAASMGSVPSGWHEVTPGWIKIFPAVYTVVGMYRFVYYHEPEFPATASRSLFGVPEGTDVLLEYLTATYLAGEKIEDKAALLQINFFGQSFVARWQNWIRGRGGGTVKPVRRYVKRIAG